MKIDIATDTETIFRILELGDIFLAYQETYIKTCQLGAGCLTNGKYYDIVSQTPVKKVKILEIKVKLL